MLGGGELGGEFGGEFGGDSDLCPFFVLDLSPRLDFALGLSSSLSEPESEDSGFDILTGEITLESEKYGLSL